MRKERIALIVLHEFLKGIEKTIGKNIYWFQCALVPHSNKILFTTMARVKLTVIEKRKYSFKDLTTGQDIEGVSYTAFNEQDKPLVFTSQDYDHPIHSTEIGFNPEACEVIDLKVKVWDGKVKYQENMPEPEEDSEDEG